MRVIYLPLFRNALNIIASNGQELYSQGQIRKLLTDIRKLRSDLPLNSHLGQREPILEGFKLEYRRIVIRPYFKIIYTIKGNLIYFVDIWDTRRDPNNLKSRIST